MIVTHGLAVPSTPPAGHAVIIGNFDGVHRGHQAMIARAIAAGRELGVPACALTFEPHPREVFAPEQAPTRLTSLREKIELLDRYGLARAHIERFTREFAALSPRTFVELVLVKTLAARWVLVGGDFRFGARRAGDVAMLRELGSQHGFEVEAMPNVMQDGERVSSSSVRAALAAGDLGRTAELLGRHYSISGSVVHGDKLGRDLGFATANVSMQHNRPPLSGIFAVRLHGAGAEALDGVASLGVRPTVKAAGAEAVLEVHVFDFAGEIYGEHVRVEFLRKIRDEEKYPDLDTLKAQIARDCEAARQVLREFRQNPRT